MSPKSSIALASAEISSLSSVSTNFDLGHCCTRAVDLDACCVRVHTNQANKLAELPHRRSTLISRAIEDLNFVCGIGTKKTMSSSLVR